MFSFIKSRWQLLAVLCVFIVLKLPALHFPFYWDESWSYEPAVNLMYQHGPSLSPAAIDPLSSRGHPLLFYALAAAWMKVFGVSHLSQHAFALLIFVAMLVAAYHVTLRLFGKRPALLVLLLVPLQVAFFVQSTFVLPEVLISLLVLLTLFHYVRGNYLYTGLACTALMFTKESGMVLGGVLLAHVVVQFFSSASTKVKWLSFSSVAVPWLSITLFFVMQRHIRGWYFYPEHLGYIISDSHLFWKRIRFSFQVFFTQNNRAHLWHLLLLLALILGVNRRQVAYALPLLAGYIAYCIIEDKFMFVPRLVLALAWVIVFVLALIQIIGRVRAWGMPGYNRFIALAGVFIVCYLIFTCINFYTPRYLLTTLLLLLIIIAVAFETYFREFYGAIINMSFVLIVIIGMYGFQFNSGVGDMDLGAFSGMKVQDSVVTYMERNSLYDSIIASHDAQHIKHLTDAATGFLHGTKTFAHASFDTTGSTRFIILDNIEPDSALNELVHNQRFHCVYTTQSGMVWASIYERK